MTRFTIYTYLFKPINEPQEPDMFSPLVKVEESLAMKQELLGELFLKESKLRFTKSRNNSDSDYNVTPCLALCDVMIVNMREQICLLTEARDRLLPKLMSGEIAV